MQFRLFHLVAALGLLLAALPGRATTVIQPTFNELVASAEYIVRVEVVAVNSSWRDNRAKPGERYIGSQISLNVREVIKGTPPHPLVLDVVGGRVGNDELVIDGAPKLRAGDECILFVRGNGKTFFPLVGLMHGYFPVYRDAVTRRASVLRSDGRPLRNVSELQPGAPTIANAKTPALTPEVFRDRIRRQQFSHEEQR